MDAKHRRNPARGGATRETRRKVPPEAVASVNATLAEEGLDVPENVTLTDAKTAHEIVKTHLARLRLQTLRGELVDRAKAVQLVFELARADRNSWQAWPSRISSQMAAELGCDAFALENALNERIREHLLERSNVPFDLESARRKR